MAYTIEQKAALEKALASGELRVSYNGNTVEYRSIAEIKAALATVTTALAGTRIRQLRVTTGRGL